MGKRSLKIFVMGSCRVQSSLRQYKRLKDTNMDLYIFPPLMHTVEQFIQAIKIKIGLKKCEEDIFDMRWGDSNFINITDKNKFGKVGIIQEADVFVIEICGAMNNKCEHGNYLHPFSQFYNKNHKYKKEVYGNFANKLKNLHDLLYNKPIIFVTNQNINNKIHRLKIESWIKEYVKNNENTAIWNPTKLIKETGIGICLKDENHFTDYMKNLQAENILKLCEEIV